MPYADLISVSALKPVSERGANESVPPVNVTLPLISLKKVRDSGFFSESTTQHRPEIACPYKAEYR